MKINVKPIGHIHNPLYNGAAPIPYVQDAILNLPNSYLRHTTVLLDINLFWKEKLLIFH